MHACVMGGRDCACLRVSCVLCSSSKVHCWAPIMNQQAFYPRTCKCVSVRLPASPLLRQRSCFSAPASPLLCLSVCLCRSVSLAMGTLHQPLEPRITTLDYTSPASLHDTTLHDNTPAICAQNHYTALRNPKKKGKFSNVNFPLLLLFFPWCMHGNKNT